MRKDYIKGEFTKEGQSMHLTSYLQEGTLTVVLTGEIDHHCAKHYIQAITAKIEAYTPQVCILDFQEVSFMDSSGIAVVINALRNMAKIEGKQYPNKWSRNGRSYYRAGLGS